MTDAVDDERFVHPSATLGDPDGSGDGPAIGDGVTIRAGSTIYSDVVLGDDVSLGHDVLIREETDVGAGSLVGTKTVIDGRTVVGQDVSIQTGVYVPPESTIEDRAFLGPCATLTNDPYPLRKDVELDGPTIERDASVGANATILPGVTVGAGAFVAAGAVVTEDVPPNSLAIGAPATIETLPEELRGRNRN